MKIALFTFTRSSLGHLIRSMAVALELQRRQHEIVLCCSEETIHIPRGVGLNCQSIPELEPMPPWTRIKTVEDLKEMTRTRLANPDFLQRCLDEESHIVTSFQPDLVISDLRNTAGVVASSFGIPSLSIHNTKLFVYPLSVVIPMVIDTLHGLGVSDTDAGKIFGDVLVIPDFSFFEPLQSIPEPMLKLILGSVREIYYSGPLLREGPSDLPPKMQIKEAYGKPRLPLLFITFGGSPTGEAYLKEVLDGLQGLQANMVIISGPNVSRDILKPYVDLLQRASPAATIHLFEYTDDSLACMKAADAAIIHGGHGTTMEGIMCGTPLIIIPHNKEQEENGQRSVSLGAGMLIKPSHIRTEILPAVKRLFTDTKVKAAAERTAGHFRHFNGSRQLADYIEKQIWIPEARTEGVEA